MLETYCIPTPAPCYFVQWYVLTVHFTVFSYNRNIITYLYAAYVIDICLFRMEVLGGILSVLFTAVYLVLNYSAWHIVGT